MDQQIEIELWTKEHVATFYRVKKKTLDNWRSAGRGPNFLKIGGNILYRKSDVLAYVNGRVFSSTSEYTARSVK